MKKISFLLAMLLFMGTALFTACTEEEDPEPTYPEIQTFTGKQFTFTTTDPNSSFLLNAETGAVMGANGTAADMDLAFAWNGTSNLLYSVVSPDNTWIAEIFSINGKTYSTADKNKTKIQKYTGDFATLDAETIDGMTITSETTTSGGNGVNNVAANDLIAFETADGLKGVIKIGNMSKVTKYLTVDMVVQKKKEETSSK